MVRFWVALDVSERDAAEARMARLAPHRAFKVGLELYHRIGPEGVLRWTQEGYEIFLDMKLHDIPRTVAGAVANLARLGVSLITLHVSGGRQMLEAAREAAPATTLIGVTVLTSLGAEDLAGLGYACPLPDLVALYAQTAHAAGLAGVVVSARELPAIRRGWPRARFVVPGIRWADDADDDQKRVGQPEAVVAQGGTDLVLGRGLWQTADPVGQLEALKRLST